jgi:hypothetical protein
MCPLVKGGKTGAGGLLPADDITDPAIETGITVHYRTRCGQPAAV